MDIKFKKYVFKQSGKSYAFIKRSLNLGYHLKNYRDWKHI